MNSGTCDGLIPEKYIFAAQRTTTEDNNTDHDHDRYGNLVKSNTLPDECLSNKSSSGEELKWSLYIPRKQGDLKLEKHEESGNKALAHLGLADEMTCGGSHSARRQGSLERRSTPNTDRIQPCEEHLVGPSLRCDRQSNAADDVVNGTFNHEMVLAGKNELPHNITGISSDESLTKVLLQLQDQPSSSAYTKSSFQGGKVVADDSPKHPDYAAANQAVATNTMKEIQRNAKTSFASVTLSRAAHEIKCSYEGPDENQYTGVERFGGLKGGQKDQSSKTWDRRDTLDLDSASNQKSAKRKEKEQLYSDFPSNTMRGDKGFLSGRVGESDFFGIRPFFLARHADDNCMSMTSDTWTEENNDDTPSDILSRYQRFGCHPERCYHSRSTCPPSLLPPKGTECHTGPQLLPPPILQTDPAMTRSFALTNGNEQQPQANYLDKEPANFEWSNCPGIYPSNSNVSIRNFPPPPPLPSPPCGESEYHVPSDDDLSNGGLQSKAPQAVSTTSYTLFAETTSSRSQVVATTRPENTGLGLLNNNIDQKEIGHPGISVNPTSTFQSVIRSLAESSSTSETSKKKQREAQRADRETATATVFTNDESSTMRPVLHNSHISDDESLVALERRVAEACSLVERVLKEREEKEKARKDGEQKQREERTRRELQEQERREREARESMQRNYNEEGTWIGSEEGVPSERAALLENPQWLCEHYQRLCRVKFPCCGKFYPCHRCHNNSDECQNKNCKAKEAFYIECSICRHQQAVSKSSVI